MVILAVWIVTKIGKSNYEMTKRGICFIDIIIRHFYVLYGSMCYFVRVVVSFFLIFFILINILIISVVFGEMMVGSMEIFGSQCIFCLYLSEIVKNF